VSALTLRFLGSGDAFGSGGRFQACILASSDAGSVLIDCGASSLIALKQAAIDPNRIDAIVVSHFHGDHFGGIPFFIIDGQIAKRERPLVVAGPPGIAGRVRAAFDALFPGSADTPRAFGPVYVELHSGLETAVGPATVTAIGVEHTPGTNAHGLRIGLGDRTVGYSGDTAWTQTLLEIAARTDAFICECLAMSKQIPFHLNAREIAEHRPALDTQRLILTHLGPETLGAGGQLAGATVAHDGLVMTIE
jgi:ribonuclease BN (tRNA processing enzyme)